LSVLRTSNIHFRRSIKNESVNRYTLSNGIDRGFNGDPNDMYSICSEVKMSVVHSVKGQNHYLDCDDNLTLGSILPQGEYPSYALLKTYFYIKSNRIPLTNMCFNFKRVS
jgi:hypothetical protein